MSDAVQTLLIIAAVFSVFAAGIGIAWVLQRALDRGRGRRWAEAAHAIGFVLRAPDPVQRARRGTRTLEALHPEQWLHRRGELTLYLVSAGLWRGCEASIQMCRREIGGYRESRVIEHTLVGVALPRSLRLGLHSPYQHWNPSASLFSNTLPSEAVHQLRMLLGLPALREAAPPDGYEITAGDDTLYLIHRGYDFDAANYRAALEWLVHTAPLIIEAREQLPPSAAEAALAQHAPGSSRSDGQAPGDGLRGEVKGAMVAARPSRPTLHTTVTVTLPRAIDAYMRLATTQAGHDILNPPGTGETIGPYMIQGTGTRLLESPTARHALHHLGTVGAIVILPTTLIVYVEGALAPEQRTALAERTVALAHAMLSA